MSAERSFRRFEPPARLRDVVEHAWVAWRPATSTREVLLPDGCGQLLLVAGAPAVVTDPLTGDRHDEESTVRGPALAVQVRETTGPGVALGLVLTPVGLARLWAPRPALRGLAPAADLLGADTVTDIVDALTREEVEAAVLSAWVAVDRVPRRDSEDVDLLAQALTVARSGRGMVRGVDLAHEVGVPLGQLHRLCSLLLGLDPGRWLSTVRFAAFVRESVGPGPVLADQMVAALRWYLQAGYSPRETERFTGLPTADLRRLADRLEQNLSRENLARRVPA
ncbi:MAG: hypothetical protein LBU50_07425 [Cellulomonas sp.]|jgi:hypothetical protein|nr:hypothetical protein [Cellulomonas sp.]